jgi:uncharacterized membrane protein
MKRALGYLLVLVSLFFLGVAVSLVVDAAAGKDTSDSIGGAAVLVAVSAMSLFGAFRSFRPRTRREPRLSEDERERKALGLARAAGGKLTQAELALDSSLSLDEARKVLDGLVEKGAAELEVSSSGALVYAFPGLISGAEKAAAKPVQDA